MGIKTVAMALEHSWNAGIVEAEVHVPPAAQWLRVAGGEIERLCTGGTERCVAGDVWKGRGGSNVCDLKRYQFWIDRIWELGFEHLLQSNNL